MKCPHCGGDNPENLFFCQYCGSMLNPNGSSSVGSFSTFSCPFCHARVATEAHFCPRCGKNVNAKQDYQPVTDPKEVALCPNCHSSITQENKTCPHCGQKLTYLNRLSINEKKEMLQLLLSGLGLAFCGLVPILGISFSVCGIVLSSKAKKKSVLSRDCFILGWVGVVLAVLIFVVNFIVVFQSLL